MNCKGKHLRDDYKLRADVIMAEDRYRPVYMMQGSVNEFGLNQSGLRSSLPRLGIHKGFFVVFFYVQFIV